MTWCGKRDNVRYLKTQAFYRWIRKTYVFHPLALAILLYTIGGFPYTVWGIVVVSGCESGEALPCHMVRQLSCSRMGNSGLEHQRLVEKQLV
ncbi:hypothetical protein LINGRAHAP2_LOCUS36283 [Linum grandiflorum]